MDEAKVDRCHAERFRRGDVVVVRHVLRGRVFAALAVRVIEDSARRIAFLIEPGTHWLAAVDKTGRRVRPAAPDWRLQGRVWLRHRALHIVPEGRAHSVVLFWTEKRHRLVKWYVNLQEPLRRSRFGFDTMDQELDIVIAKDLSAWHWKDEREFRQLTKSGAWSLEASQDIWREGESVLSDLRERRPPFNEPWNQWRAEQGWRVPRLPAEVLADPSLLEDLSS